MATQRPPGEAGPGEAGVFDDRATSEVIASLITNTQGLVRTEVELAKLEITQIVRTKLIAVALVVVAALLGLFLLAFIGVTAAHALMLVVEPWLAWLIVTGSYLLLAGILVAVAIPLLKRSVAPEHTKAELQELKRFATDQVSS
ncbi:MAG: phage holin family protein [Nitriliruptoraceae bacterium]|nr:phage holin family protein [Nitriliruptoraceae bacterium]